jgi:hypothetical protein
MCVSTLNPIPQTPHLAPLAPEPIRVILILVVVVLAALVVLRRFLLTRRRRVELVWVLGFRVGGLG